MKQSLSRILFIPLAVLMSCRAPRLPLEPGIPLRLAQLRRAQLTDLRYDLTLWIPPEREAPITGHLVLRYRLRHRRHDVVLDFQSDPGHIRSLQANRRPVPFRAVNGHIVIPAATQKRGENRLVIDFDVGTAPLNRHRDFLYSLFVPDRAAEAFPCFDQPDLKARWRLTLHIPADWVAVSNAPMEEKAMQGKVQTLRFGETPPLPTYLFAFAAGKFQVIEQKRDGRTMHLYYRESDPDKVQRNVDAIFDLHARALRWLEKYTGIPYPFPKFDFVLIPAFQFGGMEHPGSIYYRADRLFLESSATRADELGRASVIAHETTHMWFGDLVTMTWFNDVWLKEVFANFMAAKIVRPLFPDLNHDLRFVLSHFPGAYSVDRSAGTHPIRQKLDNLNRAASLYGAIIYQKAPIVMRHLERMLGEKSMREGLREYLQKYRYANADWHDLIAILDRHTDQDLITWSRQWVEQAGRPSITVQFEAESDGTIRSLALEQSDPRGGGQQWTQWLTVHIVGPEGVRLFPVLTNASRVPIPGARGVPAPRYILPNGNGLGYGRFALDPASQAYLLAHLDEVAGELQRAVAWLDLWDAMLDGDIRVPAMFRLALRMIEKEPDELLLQRILNDTRTLFWRFLLPVERQQRAEALETTLWKRLEQAETGTQKAMLFRAYRSIALSRTALRRLQRIWSGSEPVPGLELAESDYARLALELAVRGVPDSEKILQEQLRRITDPDRKARFAFILPAVSPEREARDALFQSFADPRNRSREPWVVEALTYLNHPLRANHALRYLRPGLDLLQDVERTGDIFFPQRWLNALFSGHQSPQAAQVVTAFLEDHPDYPEHLRRKILQAADLLFRAARILFKTEDAAKPPAKNAGRN